MIELRLIVFACCVWTSMTTGIRAEMLRPRLDPRPEDPRPTYNGNLPVILCLDLAALAFAGWAIELYMNPAPTSPGPTAVSICAAVASTGLLVSMIGHNRRERVRRAAALQDHVDASKVDEAVAAIPLTIEGALPQVFRDLAAQPDPYQPGTDKPV